MMLGSPATDSRTRALVELVKAIGVAAQTSGFRYFIIGGLAIDLALGAVSRSHDDIDMICEECDAMQWREWFATLGFSIARGDYMRYFPSAFSVHADTGEALVEVYPMQCRDDGSLFPVQTSDHSGREWWAGKSWAAARQVQWDGAPVWVERLDDVARQKLDHVRFHRERLDAKHIHDLELLGRRAAYERLVKELGL